MTNLFKLLTQDEFIEKAQAIHGIGTYDYSKSIYVKSKEKIIITCPTHGDFFQKPNSHLNGSGCRPCGIIKAHANTKTLQEDFIKKAKQIHQEVNYDYSKVQYVSSSVKICIICPSHGEFLQAPAEHLAGKGCRQCGIDRRAFKKTDTLEQFIEKANITHNNFYSYENVILINDDTPVLITCPIHGDFQQTPQRHKSGKWICPSCSDHSSKGEMFIENLLQENSIEFIRQKGFDNCINPNTGRTLRFDFYLPNRNILIEFDGEQHFKPVEIWGGEETLKAIQHRDQIKNNYCEENNIPLLRIRFDHDIENSLIAYGVIPTQLEITAA